MHPFLRRGSSARLCAALAACLLLVQGTLAQSLSGRWALSGPALLLDNGEVNRTVLELRQSGDSVTGRLVGLGGSFDVRGTVRGGHLDLFAPWDTEKAFVVGDLVDGELRVSEWGNPLVGCPAGPGYEIAAVPYIEAPELRTVPYNGLARTPPMGWNSWNLFQGRVNDRTMREIADAMVRSGMRDAGYVYVNIDDTWEGIRDARGSLRPNHKFPDMKALADYVHSRGLKLGIYSSPGPRTCAGYPGSYGHELQDAGTFAAWGVDYLKYDWCSAGDIYSDAQLQAVYQKMGFALQATGRPIVFSLCEYGRGGVERWGSEVGGNLWRTTDDIRDEWSSMIANVERQAPAAPHAGPGRWNDPDMLEIGNGHMTDDEYRTHMSLWALVAAPLLAGNDIRSMTPATRDILLNGDVISVDQDALGRQATPRRDGGLETWVKPLADGSVAVGVVNLGTVARVATVRAADLGLAGPAKARDLWAHREVDFAGGGYSASVPPHGVLLLKVGSR